MNKEKRRVPKLRFPGFTEDWEQRKLSEFVDKAVDNRGKTPPLDENGAHPLIEVAALGGVYPDYSKVEKYLSDDVFNTNLRAYIKKDDILFTTVGSIGLVSLMDSREEAAIAQNIVAFRAKENFLPEYLYALFSNEDNQYKAKRIAMVAVQPSIKVSQLVNVEYMISTNIEEQERIGVFFSSLQSLITLHQRKLEHLNLKKKALLQKLFPKNGERYPEFRFPGFTDAWEQRKLTSFIQRVKGNDGRMDLPTLTISASEGWLNQKDRFSANIAGSEQKNYTLLRQGELSYNHGNSKLAKYGVVYVLKDYKEALVPRVYHSFKVDESYDALFVEYYFSTKRPDRELAKLVSSGARMDGLLNIGYDEFANISIAVPTFSEQRQIVALLRRFDKFITLHQRKLDHLQLQKKALLQQMFV